MVLDTSAIVAILGDEPERERCVIEGRKRDAGRAELELLLREAAIEIAPVTADQAEIACEAFRRFGRGPARRRAEHRRYLCLCAGKGDRRAPAL